MGFSYRLSNEIVQEWEDAYIDYPAIKQAILDAQTREKTHSRNGNGDGTADQDVDQKAQHILGLLDDELEKVEAFYQDLLKEARQRLTVLKKQLKELRTHRHAYQDKYSQLPTLLKPGFELLRHLRQRLRTDGAHGSEHWKLFDSEYKYDPHGYGRAKAKLQAATSDYYVFLGSVQNYCSLNMAGFEKSVRKLDQELGVNYHNSYLQTKVHKKDFSESYTITKLQLETEEMVANELSTKSKKEVAHELRATVRPDPAYPLAVGRGGIMLGLGAALGAFGIYSATLEETRERVPTYETLLQIYSAFFLPVLLAFTVGIDLYILDHSKINVTLIFSFDRRTHIHRQQYYELPSFFFLTLTTCLCLSFTCTSVDPTVWPAVWLVSTIALFVSPFRILHYHARWWLIRTTFRVFASGILQVEFRDFWLGDQFCSLYYSVYNLGLFACAYKHHFTKNVGDVCDTNSTWISPFLACLPFFFRFGHSCRRFYNDPSAKIQLVNAAKYAASIIYQALYFNYKLKGSKGTVPFALFVSSAIFNSMFSFIWDVAVDWGLGDFRSKNFGLRDKLSFGKPIKYYLAILANLILRFAWTLYLTGNDHGKLKGFTNATLEALRRWLWNIIRLESEHIGNVDNYKATREVPLPYIVDSSDDEGSYDEGSMLSEEEGDAEQVNENTSLMKSKKKKPANGYSAV